MSNIDLISSLAVLHDNYRLGIPNELLAQNATSTNSLCWLGSKTKIIFLVSEYSAAEQASQRCFVGQEGELLKNAIERGLKLSLEQVAYLRVREFRSLAESLPKEAKIITLGLDALNNLLSLQLTTENFEEHYRGKWQTILKYQLLPTISLTQVLDSPTNKRLFWDDLQIANGIRANEDRS